MANDEFEVPVVNFGKSDDTVIYNPLAGDFRINIPHEYYHTINNNHNLHSEYVSIPKKEYLELNSFSERSVTFFSKNAFIPFLYKSVSLN